MNAPNRSQEVKEIVRKFGPVVNQEEWRLNFLLTTIIPELNKLDAGGWSHLVKTDQGNKIPVDIVVWRETREHFDVLTGTGPTWIAHGVVTNPAWITGGLIDPPTPPPPPEPKLTLRDILAELNSINTKLNSLAEFELAKSELVLNRLDNPPSYVGRLFGFEIKLTPQ